MAPDGEGKAIDTRADPTSDMLSPRGAVASTALLPDRGSPDAARTSRMIVGTDSNLAIVRSIRR